jgi:hypothetical protein
VRYVVTRPFPGSNVGSNLASLAGAVLVAQRLDRELIVDWRGMAQLQDTSINYFAEFFETRPALLGVPTSYAPVDGAEYARETGAPWLNANEAAAAARGELDLADREFVVLEEYHGPDRLFPAADAAGRFEHLRRFYREIAPGPELRSAIDRWADGHLGGRFVVGVNVRTGNGAYFAPGQPYAGRVDIRVLEEGERLVRALERTAAKLAGRLPRTERPATVTFFATDSQPMSELLGRLPGSVTRRRTFPPPDTGDLHAFDGTPGVDRASVADTLADMFLLGRCDALIYNNSLFNQYARVLNGYFGGNQVHIDTLFWRSRLRMLSASVRRRL